MRWHAKAVKMISSASRRIDLREAIDGVLITIVEAVHEDQNTPALRHILAEPRPTRLAGINRGHADGGKILQRIGRPASPAKRTWPTLRLSSGG